MAVAAEHDGMEILCMSRHRGGMLAGALFGTQEESRWPASYLGPANTP